MKKLSKLFGILAVIMATISIISLHLMYRDNESVIDVFVFSFEGFVVCVVLFLFFDMRADREERDGEKKIQQIIMKHQIFGDNWRDDPNID